MRPKFALRAGLGWTIATVLAAMAGGAALTPAVSAGTLQPLISQLSCNDAQPCLKIVNNSTGRAVVGLAKHASGVVGETQRGSHCCIFPLADPHPNPFAGLRGVDTSTPPPDSPEGNFSTGVFATSETGFGVVGIGKTRAGGGFFTEAPSATTGGHPALFGFDSSTDGGNQNIGVEAFSSLGFGMVAFTDAQIGVFGFTDNASASDGFASIAVQGVDGSGDGGTLNIGVQGIGNGTGVSAVGLAPAAAAGAPQFPALGVTCMNGGPAIIANNGLPNGDVMSLDCQGNLILSGSVMSNSTPLIATRTADGRNVAAFVARQAQQTIEDVGESQLVNGGARVTLDPAFASTIDSHASYLVFITPEGMTQGTLCVTERTPNGFTVRENQGGRSSIAFAYRIVAKPFNEPVRRLPLVSAVLAARHYVRPQARVTLAQVVQRMSHGHIHLPTRGDVTRPH